ncbi:dihydrofolate reductase [Streptococcaceae bacterium ESL0729]|nr:dihydrofolate reductase [Streptococcaceae bacterium ESL0729]
MMIIGILAEDKTGLIGKDGSLPWHLPAELAHFKKTTLDDAILMGRTTFEGMNKRTLPRRTTLVLTSDSNYDPGSDEILVMNSKSQVLDWYKNQDKTLHVIGGAQVIQLFEGDIDRFYRTIIDAELEGDTYFPKNFDWTQFELVSEEAYRRDDKNMYDFVIQVLDRKK